MKRVLDWLEGALDYVTGRAKLKKQVSELERKVEHVEKRMGLQLILSFVVLASTVEFISSNPSTSYGRFVQNCRPDLFLRFLVRGKTACTENIRTQADVESIWGGEFPPYEKTHIIPVSHECGLEWIGVFALLLLGSNTLQNVKIVLFGFLEIGIRSDMSGLVHTAINFIGLPNQKTFLDKYPSVLFIPLLPAREIVNWSGESYKCLIIGKDVNVMRALGFDSTLQGVSDYFCEMDSHSAEVQIGFENFKKLFLMITDFVKTEKLRNPDKSPKTLKCQAFREFLTSQTSVPWIDVRKAPSMTVVCLTFIATEIRTPTTSSQRAHRRSCPHPFPLSLRSFNSYLNMLDTLKLWPAWEQHLSDPAREHLRRTPLVLFPSCRDCSPHFPDRLYCKAEAVYSEPEMYSGLTDEACEAAVAVLVQDRVSDAEVDLVAGVRSLALARGAGEPSESEVSAATGSLSETRLAATACSAPDAGERKGSDVSAGTGSSSETRLAATAFRAPPADAAGERKGSDGSDAPGSWSETHLAAAAGGCCWG